MRQPRIGIVGVTCEFESGGQRAEALVDSIGTALEKKNVAVVYAEKVAWDSADAVNICRQFKQEELDALVIVEQHGSWILCSIFLSMSFSFQPYFGQCLIPRHSRSDVYSFGGNPKGTGN